MLIPYRSVRTPCRKETEIKINIYCAAFPVETEEEAQSILETVRKNHKDAAHNCWAWRIGTVRIREKSSDDGEPQGTAGHPMLHVLQMKSLTNTLAVVTRYFGGIKLGTGGLARAYGGILAEAVEEAGVLCFMPHVRLELTIPIPRQARLNTTSKVRISVYWTESLRKKCKSHASVFRKIKQGTKCISGT